MYPLFPKVLNTYLEGNIFRPVENTKWLNHIGRKFSLVHGISITFDIELIESRIGPIDIGSCPSGKEPDPGGLPPGAFNDLDDRGGQAIP